MWDLALEGLGLVPRKDNMKKEDLKVEKKLIGEVDEVKKNDTTKTAPSPKKASQKKDTSKPRHGRKYVAQKGKIDKDKVYSLNDAIKLVKETNYTKFDATVEMHVRVTSTKKKKEEDLQLRGTVRLPSGSPKTRKIAIASDELIESVKNGKIDFDILLATPEMMPKLAVVAKILGPKGKMPSPKAGTITKDPEKTKTELSSGLIEYKTDAHGILHLAVGKVSWDADMLKANIETILGVLPKKNITSITLASTMSPGIKVAQS